MDKIKIDTCKNSKTICPSQWNLTTEDDHDIYVRYRWGHLSAVADPFSGTDRVLFGWESGDNLDGFMTTQTMTRLLSEILDFSNAEFIE
jgi:hypothetical protein